LIAGRSVRRRWSIYNLHNRRGFAIKKSKKRADSSFSLIALHHFGASDPSTALARGYRIPFSLVAIDHPIRPGWPGKKRRPVLRGQDYNSAFNGIPATRFGLV